MISNQERADRIRESFYGEVPSSWTFDHDDTDLAYPMVEQKAPLGFINFLMVLGTIGLGWGVLWLLIWGVGRAIDAGHAAW